jgi:hypothetical protein
MRIGYIADLLNNILTTRKDIQDMKKTYMQPQSATVHLYAEEAMLNLSGGAQIEVNKGESTDVRWSQKQNDMWGNPQGDMWGNMDKD